MDPRVFYPLFETSEAIKNQVQDFFATYGFAHLHIRRTFKDGSIVCLTTTPLYFAHTLSLTAEKTRPTYQSPKDTSASGMYLWDEALPPLYTEIGRQRFSLYHGIACFWNHENYSDVVGLSFSSPHASYLASYFSLRPVIQEFSKKMITQNEPLLTQMKKKNLVLPSVMSQKKSFKQVLRKYFEEGRERKSLIFKEGEKSLCVGSQEMQVLHMFLEGKTFSDMGHSLQQSASNVFKTLNTLYEKFSIPSFANLSLRHEEALFRRNLLSSLD